MDRYYYNGPKLIRCTERLKVLTNMDEQLEIIKLYHQGKNNPRGIVESLKTIGRKYYWKTMKSDIQNYINDCEICKKTKYERNAVHVPIMTTETPQKPLEKIHIDTFSIERENFIIPGRRILEGGTGNSNK